MSSAAPTNLGIFEPNAVGNAAHIAASENSTKAADGEITAQPVTMRAPANQSRARTDSGFISVESNWARGTGGVRELP